MKQAPFSDDARGFITLVALFSLVLLTMIGIAVTTTSSIELQVSGNQRRAAQNFYDAEAGLAHTAETAGTWLPADSPLLTADGENADEAGYPAVGEGDATHDVDKDDADDVKIEIRRIEDSGSFQAVTHLSHEANRVPLLKHKTPPPAGSGYSMKWFEVRRYGITISAFETQGEEARNNSQLQTGVWKVFVKVK